MADVFITGPTAPSRGSARLEADPSSFTDSTNADVPAHGGRAQHHPDFPTGNAPCTQRHRQPSFCLRTAQAPAGTLHRALTGSSPGTDRLPRRFEKMEALMSTGPGGRAHGSPWSAHRQTAATPGQPSVKHIVRLSLSSWATRTLSISADVAFKIGARSMGALVQCSLGTLGRRFSPLLQHRQFTNRCWKMEIRLHRQRRAADADGRAERVRRRDGCIAVDLPGTSSGRREPVQLLTFSDWPFDGDHHAVSDRLTGAR